MEGETPSQATSKLHRGIRVFASNYLQDNLLLLPSLPTVAKLRQIREAREREAKERIQELERQRDLARQQEAARGAGVASAKEREPESCVTSVEMEVASTKVEVTEKRGLEKLKAKMVSFKRDLKGDGGSVAINMPRGQRAGSGSGWMGDSLAVGSVDSSEDPFMLQKQQLLSYIQQAKKAKRMDEVAALEASLRDIEVAMSEHNLSSMSYGFNMD